MAKLLLNVSVWILVVATVATTAIAQPNVRINEVYYRGSQTEDWVELKNIGDEALDVSQHWLYSESDFAQLNTLTLISGDDLNIEPGDFIVLQSWRDFNDNIADVSLFHEQSFNNPNSITDFVCWGGQVGRYDIAVEAGVWDMLQQLPVAFDDQSSQWLGTDSGPGDATQAIDWVRDTPTPGDENAGVTPTAKATWGQIKAMFF